MNTKSILSRCFITLRKHFKDGTKIPRRKVLKAMVGLAVLAVDLTIIKGSKVAPDASVADRASERTAAIDKWLVLFGRTASILEQFCDCLIAARALPPTRVDGQRLLELQRDVLDHLNSLASNMETDEFGQLFWHVTEKYPWGFLMRNEIQQHKGDRERWQLEIDTIRESDPATADELQILLDVHFSGEVTT